MANLSHVKSKPCLKSFDLSHIEIRYFDLLKAMHTGKVKTVIDASTGEPALVTAKMYRQLLKVV